MVTEQEVRKAYVRIREIDNTIPDDVLNLMKDAAIDRIKGRDLNYYSKKEIEAHLETYK